MTNCYIFNPDHDMALADNSYHYMPPVSIDKMAIDLALLPLWYSEVAGFVLAPSAYNMDFIFRNKHLFNWSLELMTLCGAGDINDINFLPWGWNKTLYHRLNAHGVNSTLLPDTEYIEKLRDFSHRKHAVSLLAELTHIDHCCGQSLWIDSIGSCKEFILNHNQTILKAPLSGSGKGLKWCDGEFSPSVENWCKRLLMHNDGIIVEPVYDKVLDFAMEFIIDGDFKIQFLGYSLFKTSPHGAYEGNVLDSDDNIEKLLLEYVPASAFCKIRDELMRLLPGEFKGYSGPVGVDMMICQSGQTSDYKIHPCVEINLRMNMGIVAHQIYKNFVSAHSKGYFSIVRYTKGNDCIMWQEEMQGKHPLNLKDGKVETGFLALTPVTKHTQYCAFICIE